MEVKVTDNSQIFKNAKDQAILAALNSIGETAEGYAAMRCPVSTGRLRNSITHATQEYRGKGSYTDDKGNVFNDANAKGTPEKEAVYIGTNVEYAQKQEISDSYHHDEGSAHFLRDAAATHGDEYKRIAEIQLKKAQ